MQLLYALNRDEEMTFNEALKLYEERISESYELFLFNLFIITEVTNHASTDFKNRKKKHLPTEYDKSFSDKLQKNDIISGLLKNKYLANHFKKSAQINSIDEDLPKKIYNSFSKEEVYEEYIGKESSLKDHTNILLELYRFCRKNEVFEELIEGQFTNYEDDKSLVIGATKKILKNKVTETIDFKKEYYPDEEIVEEFGKVLLHRTFNEDKAFNKLIKPHLKNWDHDRVAIIDMILLKLSLTELLYFESIPTKVTINEYLEIAKMYSTPKSNEFINGLLDTLLVLLTEEGKVKKSGRGLLE
jgi:N utilization substance protein B